MFLLVFFVYKKALMPYYWKVPPVATAFQKAPLVHGIAAVMKNNGDIADETRVAKEKVLPVDKWKELYNPYSADEYLFGSNTPFIDDLSAVYWRFQTLLQKDMRDENVIARNDVLFFIDTALYIMKRK